MYQSHTYFMLWANQALWIFQCPVTLQCCICQVLRQTVWNFQSHGAISSCSSRSLELSIPRFPPDLHHLIIYGSWRQQGTKFDRGKKWLAAMFFLPPPALLLFSTSYSCSFSKLSRSSLLFIPHLSSVASLVLTPTLLPLLVFSLLVHTVLHGQFTKSDIHSPFSPWTFNTIFNTETSKVENPEKERMKEN